MKKILTTITLIPALLFAGAASPQSGTRDIMQNVAESLEVLLPLSLDSDTFLNPDNRDVVMRHLSRLEQSADALAEHGDTRSMDFRLLASAFARATRRIHDDFERLHPAEARYFLMDLTQHCVACHSRQAAGRDFPLSSALEHYLSEQPITREESARLQLALRQFDDAMATWEGVLTDASVDPVDMSLDGNFVEYLTVAVRVQRKYARAAEHLQEVQAREGTPYYLRRRLLKWIEDLEVLDTPVDHTMTFSQARRLFQQPETRPGLLWNDSRLVLDLAVSASLRRLVSAENPDITPGQLAEAYYMLGVLEARTTGLYSAMPTMEYYWEAAIRTAPDSTHALNAYALLEEYTVTTHSGELPFEQTDDAFARLAELRSMLGIE